MRRNRRKLVRLSLFTVNFILLAGAIYFVTGASSSSQVITPQVALVADEQITESDERISSPLDQLSSTEIAVHVSRMTQLETAIAVTNQADSVSSRSSVMSHDDTVVSKPQIVYTDTASKHDITTYTVVAGDSVSSLANKFGVSSDTIRWSNDLSAWSTLAAGDELIIPPIDGIVYTVEEGDTPEDLADTYRSSTQKITAFNDAEIEGLVPGEQIVIPGGEQPAPTRQASTVPYYGFSFGSSAVYCYNGYVPGYCTYYVADRVSIPTNWGDARNWAAGARATPGWSVTETPRPGSIAQTTAMSWLGHVAYVEDVSEDGSQIRYSDMNGLAGYGRVGMSGWVSASTFQYYINR